MKIASETAGVLLALVLALAGLFALDAYVAASEPLDLASLLDDD